MKILGIESSCDETGVALVELDAHGRITLRGEALHSQAQMHEAYGGVVPELASRDHIRHLLPLTREVLVQAACTVQDIELVAYTRGPGLAGALLVGAGMAVALAAALARPALGIHHLEGHLLSPFLADDPPEFPFVALLVSGGHTQLMQVEGVGRYVLLGETIDDAAGEAFDKSAKLLGLGYPGGPALARLAATGQAGAYTLPRPLLHSGNLDFSFAGLKTAMMLKARAIDATFDAAFDVDASCIDQHRQRADLAAALQEAIVDVLVAKSLRALLQSGSKRLVVAGGVGANQRLREQLSARAAKQGARVYYPPLHLCSDNGAMIAGAAALRVRAGLGGGTRTGAFDVRPRWPLGDLGDLNDLDRLDDQDQPGVLTPKIS